MIDVSMPYWRYKPSPRIELRDRTWPDQQIVHSPIWCPVDLRDGNQALPEPMGHERKLALFRLLVSMGYKEIEVGFPASSNLDFNFVRRIINDGEIPEDVTIQVITQARPELIERTFDSIVGAERAIVHLYHSTSALQRQVVFRANREEIKDLAVTATKQCADHADRADRSGTTIDFEYSPESFTQTELDYALEISEEVFNAWGSGPERPLRLNLPATVEVASPNVYADSIEWIHRNLTHRDSVILSLHPHNDRGTGVAAAELGLQAGADRVEGCLFGNGERTGNACLVTLGMNLFSQGIDPQIDFSDIDAIRWTVEHCNQLRVHDRHPWSGDLVFTSFSGSHQDAINKGLRAMADEAAAAGHPVDEHPWQVPYLPIDPKDVGRSYEAVIRINSQSGKGGIAYLMKTEHGFDLPRRLQIDFAARVQDYVSVSGEVASAERLLELFRSEYLQRRQPVMSTELTVQKATARAVRNVRVVGQLDIDQRSREMEGEGESPESAIVAALRTAGFDISVGEHVCHDHAVEGGDETSFVTYSEVRVAGGPPCWGAALGTTRPESYLHAVISAINRSYAETSGDIELALVGQ